MVTTLTRGSIDPFLNWLSENGASEHTVRAYRADLTGFADWIDLTEPLPIEALESAAATYLTFGRRQWAPTTTQRKLSSLRAWARWSGQERFLARYRPPTPARPEPHPIPAGIPGVLALLDVARPNACQMALVGLCGLAGLRVSEACTVGTDDVHPLRRTLRIVGKGAKERVVPLSDAAWLALEPSVLAGADPFVKVSERRARQIITSLGARAGLGHISSHDLRATFATAAYNKSHDIRAVQELLGHASAKTTEVYTGVTLDTMRAAAEVA